MEILPAKVNYRIPYLINNDKDFDTGFKRFHKYCAKQRPASKIMQAYPSHTTGFILHSESVSQCSSQISTIILEDALGNTRENMSFRQGNDTGESFPKWLNFVTTKSAIFFTWKATGSFHRVQYISRNSSAHLQTFLSTSYLWLQWPRIVLCNPNNHH